jgi:NADH-quinone oxidoreductase subunit L
MALLAVLSVAGGALGAAAAGAPLLRFLNAALGPAAPASVHSPEAAIVATSVLVALAGVAVGWWIYRGRRDPSLGRLGRLFEQRWYVDALYDAVIVRPGHALGRWLAGPVDLGVIDGLVNGAGRALGAAGAAVRRWQTGYARQYALGLLVGTVILLGWWMLR